MANWRYIAITDIAFNSSVHLLREIKVVSGCRLLCTGTTPKGIVTYPNELFLLPTPPPALFHCLYTYWSERWRHKTFKTHSSEPTSRTLVVSQHSLKILWHHNLLGPLCDTQIVAATISQCRNPSCETRRAWKPIKFEHNWAQWPGFLFTGHHQLSFPKKRLVKR